jgi:molecular chaperone GrpE
MSEQQEAKATEETSPTEISQETKEEVFEDASLQVIGELRTALQQTESREKDIQDKHLRLHAEFDNYRRRTAKEHLDVIETANGKLLAKLSEVLDNFERAFAEENKTSNPESFEKGMQLIHDQFRKILLETGLEQMNPVGEPFDPVSQEAFLKQPSETIPENHVITVFQKGYKLKNKILKTAKVIVSAGK